MTPTLRRIFFYASLAAPVFAQPVITLNGVVNAAGYQAKLAPDTVFVIFGSGMGPATLATATAPNYPTTLANTSIAFTPSAGGSAIAAKMVYTVAPQIAGLLPSSIAPGTYAVRVTYNGQTSAAQNVTVVARSFGISSANSAGSGLAQATIGNINQGLSLTRFTAGSIAFNGYNWTLGPAHPNDTLVLWGTGGGADSANDTGGTSGDQTAAGNFSVLVDGRSITPIYAGASSGYPGLWQINFTLPADITLDCFASVQVSAGGELSNKVTVPIESAGQASCVDPTTPSSVLTKLDGGQDITYGAFAVASITNPTASVTTQTASGSVFDFTATEWITLQSGPVFGGCRLYDRTYPVGGTDPGAPSKNLDAGSKLPLSGPNVATGSALATIATAPGPVYALSFAANTLAGGSYTLTAPGGADVGPFNVTTVYPTAFTATNFDTTTLIDRTKPLTLTWTGSGVQQVSIIVSTTVATSTTRHLSTLNCFAPFAPGSYAIPAAALAYLSPAAATGTSFGSLAVEGIGQQGNFTASLTRGGQLDIGILSSNLSESKNIAVQ